MVDKQTKNKLLKELEKSGNVYLSCMKVGVGRATYYRWKEDDAEFRRKANTAERHGRENNCDLAEHALMLNVKEKKMEAIKYVLAHNSQRYKRSYQSRVLIEHRTNKESPAPTLTLEDLLDRDTAKRMEQQRVQKVDHAQLPSTENGDDLLPK